MDTKEIHENWCSSNIDEATEVAFVYQIFKHWDNVFKINFI